MNRAPAPISPPADSAALERPVGVAIATPYLPELESLRGIATFSRLSISTIRRTGTVVLMIGLLLLGGPGRAAAFRLCLPPAADDGRRLHPMTVYNGTWLPVWLRQHELCWRDEPGEVRIGLFGDSAVYGFPLQAEQSIAERVNQRFAENATPAHVFNLGYIFTYMPRDRIIIEAALPYDLDVIVYAVTLADMMHVAPPYFPAMLVRFLDTNVDTLDDMVDPPPVGLEEPFTKLRPVLDNNSLLKRWSDRLKQIGIGVRAMANHHAERVARQLATMPAFEQPHTDPRRSRYDCTTTLAENEKQFRNWYQWNVLKSVDAIRARTGAAVLIVNSPVAHEPVGACYNFRYSNKFATQFNTWMRDESERLGLPYLDLHDLLPPYRFYDSLHIDAQGQDQIAERLFEALRPLIDAPRGRPQG